MLHWQIRQPWSNPTRQDLHRFKPPRIKSTYLGVRLVLYGGRIEQLSWVGGVPVLILGGEVNAARE